MSDEPDEVEHLRQCLRQRERELEAVRRITSVLRPNTSLDDLIRDTLQTAVETVGASAGSILLHDPERDELVFRYVMGEKSGLLTGWRMPTTQGVVGRIFHSGVAEITPDALADPGHFRGVDDESGFQTRNMVTVPLTSSEGRRIGVMQILNKTRGIFADTDRAVLEILSSQAATAIETALLYEDARLAAVAKAIGDVSHDIKNMITPSKGGIETLEAMMDAMFEGLDRLRKTSGEAELWREVDALAADTRQHYLEFFRWVYEGADAVEERAREIADAVKGVITPPEFKPLHIVDIAQRVLAHLQFSAERCQVELRLDAPENLPTADLDGRRIYNALYNLVSNALPETPAGGRITVSVALEPDPGKRAGGILRILIADTGRGMPEEVRERLFTERAISTKRGGTGLGTKIVKDVIDMHHGTIGVNSAVGQGTVFTIRLPLRQP